MSFTVINVYLMLKIKLSIAESVINVHKNLIIIVNGLIIASVKPIIYFL